MNEDTMKILGAYPLRGCRFNVIRRPFSGGKGAIKRKEATKNHPAETKDEFYARLANDYFRAEPEYWFQRWKSEVHPTDVVRFRKECLDPILEAICNWYDYSVGGERWEENVYLGYGWSWRHPYGVRNSVDEGYGSDVDGYITDGSTVGLQRVDDLFPELKD